MIPNLPVIVLGAGGHAKVLIDTLLALSVELIGIVDSASVPEQRSVLGIPVIGNDETVLNYPIDKVRLVNGLGSVTSTFDRKRLFVHFKSKGYCFAGIIHPSAVIARKVNLAEGVQVMAGAVIQPGCVLGENTIVNTGASVDHDCLIGTHIHLAPGVTLCGGVEVGSGTHISTGATVIQGIRIGEGSLIAAGALVTEDVPDNVTVMGIPAKVVEK